MSKKGCGVWSNWPEAVISHLLTRYTNEDTSILAAEFGLSKDMLYGLATRRGVKKSEEFVTSIRKTRHVGNTGVFVKQPDKGGVKSKHSKVHVKPGITRYVLK